MHYTTKVTILGGPRVRERQYSQGIPIQSTNSLFYIQKLQTPKELWEAPKGDFDKIDQCVAQEMMASLDGSVYINEGFSPRCPIYQNISRGHSRWLHDCSGLNNTLTVKGTLQGWRERRVLGIGMLQRSPNITWWGFQEK